MEKELGLNRPDQLKLYEPSLFNFGTASVPKTPNEWFVQRYPWVYEKCGSPFLELVNVIDSFDTQILSLSINHDFFASVLGGRKDLGHHVIYFEPEMQWYFRDWDGVFKSTTAEKLMNLYRALMMKCCQDMPGNVHKLNLFHEWRGDKTAKLVVQRAKSILAADSSFFSATSPHQRIRGIEVCERIARRFVEEMLTSEPGSILLLPDAYAAFCQYLKQKEQGPIKRSEFKAVVEPLMRDQFNVCLRNDLRIDERSGVRGWKNVRYAGQTSPS